MDLTVVYYTCNQENPSFERRIQQSLLDTIGDLPLVSVSQEPIKFGENICVGKVGTCSQNAFRQLQIGAIEAKTKYVCTAEADYLYPWEYFNFIPISSNTIYAASNIYMLFSMRRKVKYFAPRRPTEGAMIVGREHLIGLIDRQLQGLGEWYDGPDDYDRRFPHLFKMGKMETFSTAVPLVTFKTDRNMHIRVPYDRSAWCRDLEPWGNAHELIRRFYEEDTTTPG